MSKTHAARKPRIAAHMVRSKLVASSLDYLPDLVVVEPIGIEPMT
jgi:hypothetical protein